MSGPKVRANSWFAAAILAVGTVAIFDRLQDYGPASAVRRFHVALMEGNGIDLQRVSVEPLEDPSLHILEQRVAADLSGGAHFEVARMDLSKSQVRAAVLYRVGNRVVRLVVFVLDRSGSSWKVNATQTLLVQRELIEPMQ